MPVNASVQRALSAFESDKSKVLGLTVNGKAIEPKQYIPRAEAQSAPEIAFAVPNPASKYMVVCLDLDAPFVSWPKLGPIIHWIQPGFTVAGDSSTKLTTSEPFVTNHIGPAPPPGAAPHRYAFFLFEQPDDFDGSKHAPADGKNVSTFARMRFDLDQWIQTAKLKDPIAVNYYLSN